MGGSLAEVGGVVSLQLLHHPVQVPVQSVQYDVACGIMHKLVPPPKVCHSLLEFAICPTIQALFDILWKIKNCTVL